MVKSGAHPDKFSLTVVIPVKDRERTLRRAIDSVLRQTVPVAEIIVVLNGCTSSFQSLYSSYGSTIKLLELSEANAYEARMMGAKAASSDWILFLDSDDALRSDAVRKAMRVQQACKADVVQLHIVQQIIAGPLHFNFKFPCEYNIDKAFEGAVGNNRMFNPGMAAKIFRKEVLLEVPSINYSGFWGEDKLFSMELFVRNPKVAYASDAVYFYRFGGASRTHDFCERRLEEMRQVHQLKCEWAKNRNMLDLLPAINREFDESIAAVYDSQRKSMRGAVRRLLAKVSQSS